MKKQDSQYAIEVRNLYKSFKLNSDKPRTIKEKLLFSNRNKVERIEILKNINLDIENYNLFHHTPL